MRGNSLFVEETILNTVEDLTPLNSHNITSQPSTNPLKINHFNFTILKEDNTHCPGCLNTIFEEDDIRAEKYCPECGLVLEAPYDYVGGNKIIIPFSYNYYIQQNFESEPLEAWAGYSRKSF